MGTWQEDAHFVGSFLRGGSWEIGLRIARRVRVGDARKRDLSSIDEYVSPVVFAKEAGINNVPSRSTAACKSNIDQIPDSQQVSAADEIAARTHPLPRPRHIYNAV